MITKKSPLTLRSFTILKSYCVFTPLPDTSDIESALSIQNEYPVHVDYDILTSEETGLYQIPVEVTINKDEELGYTIRVHAVAIFSFEDAQLSEEVKGDFLLWSGVAICISSIRAYVLGITAYYPMGRFLFSSVDMKDLIERSLEDTKDENIPE